MYGGRGGGGADYVAMKEKTINNGRKGGVGEREAQGGGGLTALAAAEAFDVVRLCPELAPILFVHSPATLHTLLRGACTYQTNSYYSNTAHTHGITRLVHAPSTRRTVRPFSLRRE